MFTIIISGRAPVTMVAQDATTFVAPPIDDAHKIPHVCVTLPAPFSRPELAAAIYSVNSVKPETAAFLGYLNNWSPSLIASPGWARQLEDSDNKSIILQARIVDQSFIPQLASQAVQTNMQAELAKKIALNLYRFLESYNTGGFDLSALQRGLDKWLEKFIAKAQIDPHFIFKTD